MGFRRRWPGVSYGRGEDWHYVGEAGEPAFENGWANVSGPLAMPLAFRIREAGIVDIQGAVDSGTDVQLFTLPERYRPSGISFFVVSATPDPGIVFVFDTGAVQVTSSSGAPSAAFIAGQAFIDPPIAA